MIDLFGNDTPYPNQDRRRVKNKLSDPNPMVLTYGEKPGYQCATCQHLVYRPFAKRYYKCKLRGTDSSPSLDHRVRWTACQKYEPIDA